MLWNPQQYLKFSGHRLRPAVDLLIRIPDFRVQSIADLGAGAGNVTKLIKQRWPDAAVVGVEGSAEMVAAGKKAAPEIEWLHQDLGSWHPAHKLDLIYSNAALHWLPDHAGLFPSLMEKIEPGGILAVQMPRNFGAPSHLLIAETALNGPWRSKLEHLVTPPPVQEPEFYHGLLLPAEFLRANAFPVSPIVHRGPAQSLMPSHSGTASTRRLESGEKSAYTTVIRPDVRVRQFGLGLVVRVTVCCHY